MARMRLDWRMAVRLLGALALVLVAFAHRPLPAVSTLPDATAYAFPDGSIPVICVTSPGEDAPRDVRHGLPCDACLVAGAVLLPPPADLDLPAFGKSATASPPAANLALPRAAWSPAAPPTAPPLA